MIVNATEFRTRTGKYLDIVEIEEVIITRNGKEIAKLVPIKKEDTPNADFLYGHLSETGNKDITVKKIIDDRLNKKHGSID